MKNILPLIEKKFVKSFLILSALLLCFDNLWAQPTPSTSTELNLYRLRNGNGTTYYMVPVGTTDGSYVKTSNSTTGDDLNNVNRISAYWYFEQSGTQYYIRNLATGQYLYCPTVTQGANRVTLQSSTSSNKTLFTFTSLTGNGQTYYAILPQGASDQSLAPNNGTSTDNGNNIGLYLYNYYPSVWNYTDKVTSTLQGGLSDFTISGNTTLDTLITTNYSHTNASYTSPHFEFTINSTTYYKGTTGNPSTTAPSGSTTGITYAWTLSDNINGYATVNASSGAVTYSTLVPEASRTATLTCTATHTSSGTTNTATYTITFVNPTILQEPVISYTVATASSLEVTLSHPTTGVTIYYTTDGSDPLTSTTRAAYTAPFNVNNNTTVKAYAVKTDMTSSTVASKLIQISSGIVGNSVILYDYEDHNWAYYAGYNDFAETTAANKYNAKYLGKMYSPNPRNVKITYRGGAVSNASAVAISREATENQNEMVYYTTLEQYVIGEFTDSDNDGVPDSYENTAEQYPYTVIPNPFSKRPRLTSHSGTTDGFYGFAGWKIISGADYIQRASGKDAPVNNSTVLDLDEKIHFKNLPYGSVNCTSAEIVFEATWTAATVKEANTAQTFTGGTYETNFLVITSNTNTTITQSSPCTIMGIYPDGTGTMTTINGVTAGTDNVKVEWVNSGTGNWNANGNDFTIGRGVTTSPTNNSQSTFSGLNSSAGCENIVRLESGEYGRVYFFRNGGVNSGAPLNGLTIFGCDYDRARAHPENADDPYTNKLILHRTDNSGSSGSTKVNRSAGQLYWRGVFKSGNHLGEFSTVSDGYLASESNYSGKSAQQFYCGAHQNIGQRYLMLEGGRVNGITGGSDGNTSYQYGKRAFTLRIKGNACVLGCITGAASSYPGSGDRSFVITGGKFGGWIAAGANGTSKNGGTTIGNSYVYIGGNAIVDSKLFYTPHTINHSFGGIVYGAGCGIEAGDGSGSMEQSTNVVLADNAYIERAIYGGGAYGRAANVSGDSPVNDVPANIYILGGHLGGVNGTNDLGTTDLNGGVYGGASLNHGCSSNIYMYGGIVEGGIYGGSNASGNMANNVNVQILGGQVGIVAGTDTLRANIHGGGLGSSTRVLGSINVTIGKLSATDSATIYGDVYGGSAEGKTNGSDSRTTDATTQVSLNAGIINGNLYGGGLGTSTHAADVYGPVSVSVSGGKANNVFGCNNTNGAPQNSVSVSITGGEVLECVYGGGNAAPYNAGSLTDSPSVTMNGGKVDQHVFGGGLGSTAIITGNTIVSVLDGLVKGNVYGGGNGGAVTGNTNVTVGTTPAP